MKIKESKQKEKHEILSDVIQINFPGKLTVQRHILQKNSSEIIKNAFVKTSECLEIVSGIDKEILSDIKYLINDYLSAFGGKKSNEVYFFETNIEE